jgi:hypothetical protein
MAFKAPFYRYEDLRRCAESFLMGYHPGREIPVPIEKIIELELCMDIVPMPGLGNFDTVAYLSHNMNEIRVDEFVYNHRPNRYRFSLAHELGHRVLHAEAYQQFKFSDLISWKRVMTEAIPLDQYRYMEWHANSFAGLILVPAAELRVKFFDDVEKGQSSGIDFDEPATGARELVEDHLADLFEVSAEVVHKRIEFDQLWHTE